MILVVTPITGALTAYWAALHCLLRSLGRLRMGHKVGHEMCRAVCAPSRVLNLHASVFLVVEIDGVRENDDEERCRASEFDRRDAAVVLTQNRR
jgi:hypothetical protein